VDINAGRDFRHRQRGGLRTACCRPEQDSDSQNGRPPDNTGEKQDEPSPGKEFVLALYWRPKLRAKQQPDRHPGLISCHYGYFWD
jgi:ribonuclease I